MAWWPLGKSERVGDGPVQHARTALETLVRQREEAAKPPPTIEEIVTLASAALARSSRELQPRRDAKLVAITAAFEDGTVIEVKTEEARPAPEEVAVFRDWVKKVHTDYKEVAEELGRRRPTATEVLEALAIPLREREDPKKLRSFDVRYEHVDGQIPADEVVAMFAAALRRNERRLGLLVESGEKMSPEDVVGTTPDGKEIRVSSESGQAPRELVDDLCERFEAVLRLHRQEQPEKFLATMSAPDRERYQRNADARGLPTLEALIEAVRVQLAAIPERYAPLASLRVETSERSGIGLPSRPRPAAFVDSRLRVRHVKFGEGYVERTFEDGEKKYEVLFDDGRRATLMARFLSPAEPSNRE
jgi:hypothetical protein